MLPVYPGCPLKLAYNNFVDNFVVMVGFRYDANCPPYFVDDLELCATEYVYSQRSLLFRTDNDLVATTTDPTSITDACRYSCV